MDSCWSVVGGGGRDDSRAEEPPETQSSRKTIDDPLATVRTIAYLPFKGAVCVVGVLASFPVYWLSGLDPQVKRDTETMREKYCSQEYLFSSEWADNPTGKDSIESCGRRLHVSCFSKTQQDSY
jgi:hypothetical protein